MLKKLLIYGVILIFVFLVAVSFSEDELSREDEIRQYIDRGVEAVENRNASVLADLVHDDFKGKRRMSKQKIIKLVSSYFFQHKNIYLFTRVRDITFYSDKEASVTLNVAMAGRVISDLSVLSSLRSRVYTFELQLVKEGKWLLTEAKWQRASPADIQ